MKYNLIYFDANQLEDYFFNVDYRKAYGEFLDSNTFIFTGRKYDDMLGVLVKSFNEEHHLEYVHESLVNKIWVRGKNFDYEKYKDFDVINTKLVTDIADDKNKTYEYLKDLMPKSELISKKNIQNYKFSDYDIEEFESFMKSEKHDSLLKYFEVFNKYSEDNDFNIDYDTEEIKENGILIQYKDELILWELFFENGSLKSNYSFFNNLYSNNIIKPLNELKGNGISKINSYEDLRNYLIYQEEDKQFILQEFIECVDYEPLGIKGVHDIRLIIVNSEIVGLAVRQPKEGGWLCNVAQGGSIKVWDKNELDKIYIKPKLGTPLNYFKNKVLNLLPKDFKSAIFSIDFCNTKDGFKIFELNSYPGIRLEYGTYINKVKELLNN